MDQQKIQGNRDSAKPRVSVVLITHNRPDMLADAIRSIKGCTSNGRIEVVVVDNGSTDNTREMVSMRFPEVKLVLSPSNMGVAGARNLGVENAMGDIVVFIDDDATIDTPDIFDTVVERFDRYPNISVMAFRIVNASTNTVLKHEFPMRTFSDRDPVTERYVSYFVGCGFALRRDAFIQLGGFFAEMFYGPEEVDYSYRVLDNSMDILYCPDVVVRHRTAPEARRKGNWYYNSIRSRILMAVRNLPFGAMVPFLLIWHLEVMRLSIKTGDLKSYLRGVKDGWKDSHIAWGKRKVIGERAITKIKELSGRLYC